MNALAPPKKILTVEDNAVVSADVRSILEGAGYDVLPDARDGVEAIEHVRTYEPDLILLDLKLPRVDGVETAGLIREESDAPILVLTGYDDPELLASARAAGTSGHVLKPFSEHGLLSAVRSRLGEHEANDFGMRCMIEEMIRQGADEREIVRAVSDSRPAATRPEHGRLPGLRRLVSALRDPFA